ncbi:DUF397 domain-containing protein [Streptomyces sp. 4F14]|uniref:DUF397 domain-containing protein n=1 Tax=Streptomyces sp. 4F14 TaxID=3394380 RepID=UPI003A84B822
MIEVVSPFWKSSYTIGEGQCVEVALTAPSGLVVRDSKLSDGPLLTTSRDTWASFLSQFGN